MRNWLRILLIVTIIFGIASFLWFILGSTAYLQRGMDIIGTAILVTVGFPVIFVVISLTLLLIRKWNTTNGPIYFGIILGVVISIVCSTVLIQSVSTYGWAKEKIESDTLKITADEKYHYRIDLINLFQRNSHSRLFLKDTSYGEETNIPIEVQTRKIVVLGVSKVNNWVRLEPTDITSLYILHTTKELGIPEEKFVINIETGTSKSLKQPLVKSSFERVIPIATTSEDGFFDYRDEPDPVNHVVF